jgi:hypothetical protein
MGTLQMIIEMFSMVIRTLPRVMEMFSLTIGTV